MAFDTSNKVYYSFDDGASGSGPDGDSKRSKDVRRESYLYSNTLRSKQSLHNLYLASTGPNRSVEASVPVSAHVLRPAVRRLNYRDMAKLGFHDGNHNHRQRTVSSCDEQQGKNGLKCGHDSGRGNCIRRKSSLSVTHGKNRVPYGVNQSDCDDASLFMSGRCLRPLIQRQSYRDILMPSGEPKNDVHEAPQPTYPNDGSSPTIERLSDAVTHPALATDFHCEPSSSVTGHCLRPVARRHNYSAILNNGLDDSDRKSHLTFTRSQSAVYFVEQKLTDTTQKRETRFVRDFHKKFKVCCWDTSGVKQHSGSRMMDFQRYSSSVSSHCLKRLIRRHNNWKILKKNVNGSDSDVTFTSSETGVHSFEEEVAKANSGQKLGQAFDEDSQKTSRKSTVLKRPPHSVKQLSAIYDFCHETSSSVSELSVMPSAELPNYWDILKKCAEESGREYFDLSFREYLFCSQKKVPGKVSKRGSRFSSDLPKLPESPLLRTSGVKRSRYGLNTSSSINDLCSEVSASIAGRYRSSLSKHNNYKDVLKNGFDESNRKHLTPTSSEGDFYASKEQVAVRGQKSRVEFSCSLRPEPDSSSSTFSTFGTKRSRNRVNGSSATKNVRWETSSSIAGHCLRSSVIRHNYRNVLKNGFEEYDRKDMAFTSAKDTLDCFKEVTDRGLKWRTGFKNDIPDVPESSFSRHSGVKYSQDGVNVSSTVENVEWEASSSVSDHCLTSSVRRHNYGKILRNGFEENDPKRRIFISSGNVVHSLSEELTRTALNIEASSKDGLQEEFKAPCCNTSSMKQVVNKIEQSSEMMDFRSEFSSSVSGYSLRRNVKRYNFKSLLKNGFDCSGPRYSYFATSGHNVHSCEDETTGTETKVCGTVFHNDLNEEPSPNSSFNTSDLDQSHCSVGQSLTMTDIRCKVSSSVSGHGLTKGFKNTVCAFEGHQTNTGRKFRVASFSDLPKKRKTSCSNSFCVKRLLDSVKQSSMKADFRREASSASGHNLRPLIRCRNYGDALKDVFDDMGQKYLTCTCLENTLYSAEKDTRVAKQKRRVLTAVNNFHGELESSSSGVRRSSEEMNRDSSSGSSSSVLIDCLGLLNNDSISDSDERHPVVGSGMNFEILTMPCLSMAFSRCASRHLPIDLFRFKRTFNFRHSTASSTAVRWYGQQLGESLVEYLSRKRLLAKVLKIDEHRLKRLGLTKPRPFNKFWQRWKPYAKNESLKIEFVDVLEYGEKHCSQMNNLLATGVMSDQTFKTVIRLALNMKNVRLSNRFFPCGRLAFSSLLLPYISPDLLEAFNSFTALNEHIYFRNDLQDMSDMRFTVASKLLATQVTTETVVRAEEVCSSSQEPKMCEKIVAESRFHWTGTVQVNQHFPPELTKQFCLSSDDSEHFEVLYPDHDPKSNMRRLMLGRENDHPYCNRSFELHSPHTLPTQSGCPLSIGTGSYEPCDACSHRTNGWVCFDETTNLNLCVDCRDSLNAWLRDPWYYEMKECLNAFKGNTHNHFALVLVLWSLPTSFDSDTEDGFAESEIDDMCDVGRPLCSVCKLHQRVELVRKRLGRRDFEDIFYLESPALSQQYRTSSQGQNILYSDFDFDGRPHSYSEELIGSHSTSQNLDGFTQDVLEEEKVLIGEQCFKPYPRMKYVCRSQQFSCTRLPRARCVSS
ncbi:unnamed protein product [Soboliphyme baturini]|uniref:Phosphoinositide phospholipase C n=1 Tax=Soboliphyme baturini TaxID=241478 RepID=A0A183IXL9_9BILA|nr:unnamed protein product [Soboliphyme baturini]